MFGYITPALPLLSDEDRAIWQGFYCTLCRNIGKISQPSRLGLSYDLTFLALIISALSDDAPTSPKSRRCLLHPTKKTAFYTHDTAFDYTAKASVILIKEKLADDAKDEKNPLYSLAVKVINKDCGLDELESEISSSLSRLAEIEEKNILDVDEAADAFAHLCGKLFELSPAPKKEKRTLYWLGYNLGRWIYLLDAWDDLEKDIKKGRYNPFADGRTFEEIQSTSYARAEEMLTFTLSEAAAAFDLLTIRRYLSVLENIIYAGLPARLEDVMKGKVRNESIRGSGRKSER